MCQIVLKKDYRCRIHLFALYRMKKPNGLLIEQNVRTRLEPNSVMVFLVWCLLTVGMTAGKRIDVDRRQERTTTRGSNIL